jgi:hypothetical protein
MMLKVYKVLTSIIIWVLFLSGIGGVITAFCLDLAKKSDSIPTWGFSFGALLFAAIAIKIWHSL